MLVAAREEVHSLCRNMQSKSTTVTSFQVKNICSEVSQRAIIDLLFAMDSIDREITNYMVSSSDASAEAVQAARNIAQGSLQGSLKSFLFEFN